MLHYPWFTCALLGPSLSPLPQWGATFCSSKFTPNNPFLKNIVIYPFLQKIKDLFFLREYTNILYFHYLILIHFKLPLCFYFTLTILDFMLLNIGVRVIHTHTDTQTRERKWANISYFLGIYLFCFTCMNVLPACLYTTYVPSAVEVRRGNQISWSWNYRMVVSHHVGPGNRT